MNIYKYLPCFIKEILIKIKGRSGNKLKKKLKKIIECIDFSEIENESDWKNALFRLAGYGNIFSDFIENFEKTRVKLIKPIKFKESDSSPMVLCVVKNDLLRIQLFLSHYRKLGITHFAILDDNSVDGTREYLLKQPDVDLFVSNVEYTTVIRQVWLNKMAAIEGLERWYVIVDSDELLVYYDYEKIKINEMIKKLQSSSIYVAQGLLIDMFSEKGLYDLRVKKWSDIEIFYNLFSTYYFDDHSLFAPRLKGGARFDMFSEEDKMNRRTPVVNKYPLVYMRSGTVLINSHYNFPLSLNYNVPIIFGIKHFKFLVGDKEKYEERVKKENFGGGSVQYKVYKKASSINSEKLKIFESSESLSYINLIEKVDCENGYEV